MVKTTILVRFNSRVWQRTDRHDYGYRVLHSINQAAGL